MLSMSVKYHGIHDTTTDDNLHVISDVQKYNLWGDPLLVIMVPFVVAIAYLTGWLLLWIALKVCRGWTHP